MDASSISAVTELSEKHVLEVMRSLGHDTEKIAAAVDQYLNSKSGPLKDGTEMADGWAESGKPRRPKKVRPCCLYGPANAARAATIGPARLACAAALRGSTHWPPHAFAQPGRARVAGLPDSRTCNAPSLSLTTPCALPVLRRRATRSPRVPRTRSAPKGKARRSDASATARAAAAVAGAVRDSRARAHLVARPRRHEAPNPLRSALAPPPPPPPPSPTPPLPPPLPPPPEHTARHHALSIPTTPTISAIPAIPTSLIPLLFDVRRPQSRVARARATAKATAKAAAGARDAVAPARARARVPVPRRPIGLSALRALSGHRVPTRRARRSRTRRSPTGRPRRRHSRRATW